MTFTNEEVERIVKENNGLHKAIQKYKTQNKLLRHFVLGPICWQIAGLRAKREALFARAKAAGDQDSFDDYKEKKKYIDENLSIFKKMRDDAEAIFSNAK